MASPRRVGTETSKTRLHLLDTTERLMLDEGYAAVTSRRVAKEAGVTPPLVHYYFPSLDDLFLAVFRRRADESFERQLRLLESDQPLRAVWTFTHDRAAAAFTAEFMALANHRKSIGEELATSIDRFRRLQIDAVTAAVRDGRLDLDEETIPGVVTLLTNAAHSIAVEQALGLTTGHEPAEEIVERFLAHGDPQPTE